MLVHTLPSSILAASPVMPLRLCADCSLYCLYLVAVAVAFTPAVAPAVAVAQRRVAGWNRRLALKSAESHLRHT